MFKPFKSEFESDNEWPRELFYPPKNTPSQKALIFFNERPRSLIHSQGEFFTRDENYLWRAYEHNDLRSEIRETDPGAQVVGSKEISGMVDELTITPRVRTKAQPYQWIDPPSHAPSPNDLILARNGLVNVKTGKLISLDGYFATALPGWNYNSKADCPTWLRCLHEWLHKDFHAPLQEFFGYMLTPDTSLHASLALIGETRGGKGTVNRVMDALIGHDHCGYTTFSDFGDRFGLEGFEDKRALFMADAQDGNRRTDHANVVERIKTIAGGDPISINCKNKKQKLGVVLAAKIVIVANQHPKFLDESGALGERENVILFERYFKREERDLQLTAKLKRELPGIANWAIEGLRRLRANGEFSIVGRAAKTKADLTRQQATALRFGEECLTITGNKADMVPLKLAYDAYRLWAAEEGLAKSKIRDKTAFQDDMIAALRKHGVGFAEKQTRWHDPHLPHDGEGTRIKHRFIGVKLNRAAHPDYAGDEPDAYADFDFG